MRRLLLGTAILALAATGVAAAPPVYCMSDETGDGDWNLVPVAESPALDIVSGEFRSNRNTFVVTLRVGSTDRSNDMWSDFGYTWTFSALANATSWQFSVREPYGRDDLVPSVAVGAVEFTSGQYTFAVTKDTFVWTLPRKHVTQFAKIKPTWRDFRASTKVFSTTADDALTKNTAYVDGARSCVKSG